MTTGNATYAFNVTTINIDPITNTTALGQCTGVVPGVYNITAVSEHTLMNVKRNVTLNDSSTSVSLGTLREGNVNNDDRVNGADYVPFSAAFLKVSPAVGYNPMADFDRNGRVNGADYVLLSGNFLKRSPIEVP